MFDLVEVRVKRENFEQFLVCDLPQSRGMPKRSPSKRTLAALELPNAAFQQKLIVHFSFPYEFK